MYNAAQVREADPVHLYICGGFVMFFAKVRTKRNRTLFYLLALLLMSALVACGGGGQEAEVTVEPIATQPQEQPTQPP